MARKIQLVVISTILVALSIPLSVLFIAHPVNAGGDPTTEAIIEQTVRASLTQTARAATPEPLGRNDSVSEAGIQVTLIDYDFWTTANVVDVGVAEVKFRVNNNTNKPIEVLYNFWDIEGIDNQGIKYGEYVAALYRTCGNDALGCFPSPTQEDIDLLMEYPYTIPANSSDILTITLVAEVTGIFDRIDDMQRADIRTDWIDITIPSIVFRTDKLHEVSGEWRITR